MREEFKILKGYIGDMRDGQSVSRKLLKKIRRQINLCQEFQSENREENNILKVAAQQWTERAAEMALNGSFLRAPTGSNYKDEFLKLRDLIEEMRKPESISSQRMREIFDHIEVCNHLKEEVWQENLFSTAKLMWLDIMRERQENSGTKALVCVKKKSVVISENDRRLLKSLRIKNDFENQDKTIGENDKD